MKLNLMKLILFVSALLLMGVNDGWSQSNMQFSFNSDGNFKIAQFTDIHWGDKYAANIPWADTKTSSPQKTLDLITKVILTEKPDLVILTGDIVTSAPVRSGWDTIGKLFEETKTPWAVGLGNHDGLDAGLSRSEVMEILVGLPYFVGEAGPVPSSVGNYEIPVWDANHEKIASVIYVLNSNNRPEKEQYGAWDWIHYDQIQWYREKRDSYKNQNNQMAMPSMMFFHIPLPEFADIERNETTFLGRKSRGSKSDQINSGLYGSFLEKKEMMGVFAGHYHNTDNIGIFNGVALGLCRATGAEAHSNLERGGRIIQLYENQKKFDTWIVTDKGKEQLYHYPSGISALDEKSMNYLTPLSDFTNRKPGLSYVYYEGGRFKITSDIKKNGKVVSRGTIRNFTLDPATKHDSIAIIFEGAIQIPRKAIYRFYTNSDDGSRLWIDDVLVVDNDGSHYTHRRDGKVGLNEGFHKIKLEYFQDYLGKKIEVGWSSRWIEEQQIPENVLFTLR